ncbi:uncharacterized protein CDAR_9301 [Caerostris darwini]|uniref:Uncharacterized protein n=1 Tax=Caerostris darwini TaxID=1538125 RepID=A0AAV4S0Q3_9ARAC|nr:uncharacterized protein CDAR_9301 [Caerostris darwini]
MKLIMLPLHVCCGRMKQDSHVIRVFNSLNSHMWSGSNPHAIRLQRHQDRWSVNVGRHARQPINWILSAAGMAHGTFVLDISPGCIRPRIAAKDIAYGSSMTELRHISALLCIIDCTIQGQYTGRWIGSQDRVSWPPRYPDLTTLDFYQWGHLKELSIKIVENLSIKYCNLEKTLEKIWDLKPQHL